MTTQAFVKSREGTGLWAEKFHSLQLTQRQRKHAHAYYYYDPDKAILTQKQILRKNENKDNK